MPLNLAPTAWEMGRKDFRFLRPPKFRTEMRTHCGLGRRLFKDIERFPAYSRVFQLREGEHGVYKERVQ